MFEIKKQREIRQLPCKLLFLFFLPLPLFKPVVLNLSSFEAHFQWPKNTWAHKTFTTNFEYHKMFFININNKVRLSIIKLILMSFYQLVQLHC